jgi:choline dehydrogenase-like flavoprotein
MPIHIARNPQSRHFVGFSVKTSSCNRDLSGERFYSQGMRASSSTKAPFDKTNESADFGRDSRVAGFAEKVRVNQQMQRAKSKSNYDFIICGSGPSGSVVAQPNSHLNGRSIPLSMGKVLGGGSSINVMVWARGHKNDWEHFAEVSGDPGWGYHSVLGIYRRAENWQGAHDPVRRGVGGRRASLESSTHCSRHGSHLRIADGSIMLRVTTVNTLAPYVVTGERDADRTEHRLSVDAEVKK